MGVVSVLVRLAFMGRELTVAHWFGRSDPLDAFLIAMVLPGFMLNLLVSALGAALVPLLIETRHKDSAEAADQLLSTLMVLTTVGLCSLALLLGVFAPFYLPYLGHNFSASKLLLTRHLLYLLLPWLVCSGIANFCTAILNAGEKFALPAVVPLLTPFIAILFVRSEAPRWGIYSLAAGTVAGSMIEVVLLLHSLRSHGVQVRFRWHGLDERVRVALFQYLPMMAGAFLMGSTTVVDQSMAALLPGGSVAALNYANRVVTGLLTVGATGLSTATLPYFSKMVAQKDWHGCRHTLKRYSVLVAAITVPLTVLLIVFSKPLVRLLFERGAFSSMDTELVSRTQACYLIQIPFYVAGILFVRFLSSVRRTDLLMYISAANLVLDVVLNLVLMKRWGVAGIALSSSIVYLISCACVVACSVRLLSQQHVIQPVPTAQPQQASP